jgi:hypothetical protein
MPVPGIFYVIWLLVMGPVILVRRILYGKPPDLPDPPPRPPGEIPREVSPSPKFLAHIQALGEE